MCVLGITIDRDADRPQKRWRNPSMRKLLTMVTSLGLLVFIRPVSADQVTSLGSAQMVKRSETKSIPRDVKYVFNRDLPQGRSKKVTDGEDGEARVTVHEIQIGKKKVAQKTTKVVSKPARPAVIEISQKGFPTSRGSFSRSRVMVVESTAYTPHDGSQTGRTATGRLAKYGIIAVDPRIIPLHSLVFVEGYGFAVAADTGGAIKGNRIDVCFPSLTTANQWGRRKVVIHVFKEKVGRKE